MTEQNKLRWFRLLLIPYFIVSFMGTIIFGYIMFMGYILFGIPCWIFTGNSSAWIPDWDVEWFPILSTWEEFRDDINERQRDIDIMKPRKKK